MGLSPEELERILKLVALVQLGANQLIPLIVRLREQGGETAEQLNAHAEKANAEARKIIDEL